MKVAPGWSGKYRLSILMGLPFASRKSEGLMIGLYGVLHRSAAPAIGAVPIKEATATTPREWFVSTGHGRRWCLGISDSSLRAGLSCCGPFTHGQVGDSRASEFYPGWRPPAPRNSHLGPVAIGERSRRAGERASSQSEAPGA